MAKAAAEPKPRKRTRRAGCLLAARWALSMLVLACWGFYVWQPWVLEIFPREVPKSNPPVDPDSERLFSPKSRVLVVTGHPDDPEFYVGGTLLQLGRSGAAVTLVCATDGDKGYYPFEDHARNRRIRQAEQRRAASLWGAKEVVFLGLPDGRLQASQETIRMLAETIRRVRPHYVLTFDPEYPPRLSHGDHLVAGRAVLEALRQEKFSGWTMLFSTRAPNYVVDITREWPEKRRLLGVHASQFFGERLKRVEGMVESSAKDFGRRAGYEYGEGFRCLRNLSRGNGQHAGAYPAAPPFVESRVCDLLSLAELLAAGFLRARAFLAPPEG